MTKYATMLLARHETRHKGLSGMWDSGELLGRVAIVELAIIKGWKLWNEL